MIESLTEIFDTFHFLRPWWFLGLLPVVAVIGFYTWRKRNAGNWETIINPELLPFLLQGSGGKHALSGPWLVAFMISAWIFCCLGLAGPAWQQLPQPVHKQDSALVVVLDLSPSMLAEDISPNRLVRARYKLIDILTRRTEGVVGLIVYGGDSHTVSPLTEDSNTIVSMVPVLEPNLLPETGSNVEEGLASAIDLAMNGGYQQADILLITDGIDKSALSNIAPIISGEGNFRLSILGVGTTDGAPIPSVAGGFIKKAGNVIVAKLNVGTLRKIAANNGGSYQTLSADDRDIDNVLAGMDSLLTNSTRETDRSFDLWDDQGYWLVLLLLPVLLLSFRKGTVVVILIAPLLFTAQPVKALEWQDLWQTLDQQASEAMTAENYEAAKGLFQDSRWRGSAAFKAGDFDQAIADFSQDESATGDYNHGNALAKSGDLQGAIKAYNNALSKEPKMEDARFNLDLVEQLKDQQDQDQQEQEQQDQGQQDQEQQDQDQQNQEQQDQGQQDQEQQDQSQQDQEQQDQGQQDQEQQDQGQQDQEQQDQSQQDQEQQDQGQQDQEQQDQDQQNESDEDPAQTEQDKPEDKNEAATEEEQKEEVSVEELSDEEKQEQEAIERILRRIPDDPGGLLRAKFRHQARQRSQNRRPPTNEERW
jgi:Ca-activated chloride channel family protein